ncbi:MAG: hypothetical protein JJ879_16785 [Sneathiella sp.]|nr:hypothetical protein [Sneathiella sp.]
MLLLNNSPRSTYSPAMQARRALQKISAITRLMADMEHHQALIRTAQGPFEELCRSGVFNHASAQQEQLRPVRGIINVFNTQFTLPEVPAAVKLTQEFQQSPAVEAIARYAIRVDEIQRAMEAMHTPWPNYRRHGCVPQKI